MSIKLERVWSSALGFAKSWGPTLLIVSASVSAGVVWKGWRTEPLDSPSINRVVALGRSYPKALGAVYAGAWKKGADALEEGRAVPEAIEVVAREWNAGRVGLFDRDVAPEFAKIVPEGQPDAETTNADKAALASLWCAFAAGLGSSAK